MLQILFLNVQQGNSIIIKLPPISKESPDRYGIVDCFYQYGIESEPKCLTFLKNHNVKELEFVILSHHHEDHFLGLGQILEFIHNSGGRIKRYYEPPVCAYDFAKSGHYSQGSHAYSELMTIHKNTYYRKSKGPKYNSLLGATHSLDITDIPNELRATIVTPTGQTYHRIQVKKQDNPQSIINANMISNALLLTYGSAKILICGDCTDSELTNAINEFEQQSISLKSDLIVVSHHGGTGNPSKLWKAIVIKKRKKKSFAVISCGYANKYNHPSEKTLNRILYSGAKLYCTNKGKPCLSLNVSPMEQAIEQISADSALSDALDILKAQKIDGICSGTIVMDVKKDSSVDIHYRDQDSRCAYADQVFKKSLAN